jgi:hypothetical protein
MSDIKLLHICSEDIDIISTRNEAERMMLNELKCDGEVSLLKDWTFAKNFRNVHVSYASHVLTYLRLGLINLADIDFIVLE